MKRSLDLWQFAGFTVTLLFGTLLHFLYGWLGDAAWIAPFASINESTWEHMKLLFWPMFFFAVAQSFVFSDRKDFWCVKWRGIGLGLVLMPVLFYTYNGVIAPSPAWVNILIFVLCAAAAFIYEKRLFDETNPTCKHSGAALAALIGISVCFVMFTFYVPDLNIFKDPPTDEIVSSFLPKW